MLSLANINMDGIVLARRAGGVELSSCTNPGANDRQLIHLEFINPLPSYREDIHALLFTQSIIISYME